jgi:hypothetical protein
MFVVTETGLASQSHKHITALMNSQEVEGYKLLKNREVSLGFTDPDCG